MSDLQQAVELVQLLSRQFALEGTEDYLAALHVLKQLRELESLYTAKLRIAGSSMGIEERKLVSAAMQDKRVREARYKAGTRSDRLL